MKFDKRKYAKQAGNAVRGGKGWPLIYMPLLAGLIIAVQPIAVPPQKVDVVLPNVFAAAMRELDIRLESVETAIMAVQVVSQNGIGELKRVRTDIASASLDVKHLYQMVGALNQQIAESNARTPKRRRTARKPIKKPATSLFPAITKALTPTPASATVTQRTKPAFVKVQPAKRTNFGIEKNPVNQP